MDNWLKELEKTNDLVPGISRLIGQRKKINDDSVIPEIKEELRKFKAQLDMLQEDLNAMAANPITFRMFVFPITTKYRS